MFVRVSDVTDESRTASIDSESVGPVVAAWLAADGLSDSPAPNVARLARALRRGDWVVVHHIADVMSLEIEVLS